MNKSPPIVPKGVTERAFIAKENIGARFVGANAAPVVDEYLLQNERLW
jgi:hypothetical protein